jgi:UDP-glucose:(heptosyl)LPS alpha-1,3-glucosyltransferase
MRARARRAGVEDRIRFLGASDDVPRLLGAADLLVHPARSENTGTVILESILYGVPALVSAECGYAEHVSRSGAGAVLATPFDREAFAAEIAGLLAPARLADAKAQAQRYGQTLSAEAGLPRVAAAMLDIIARRQRGRT